MRVLGDVAVTSASGSRFPGRFLFFLAIGGVQIGATYCWFVVRTHSVIRPRILGRVPDRRPMDRGPDFPTVV
ncbi:hypothetical protein U1Q18_045117 [Sarracenia purpurea var. burkii]